MMINQSAVRPYVKAIFALALRDQQLTQWQDILKLLATVATECKKKSILKNPKIGRSQVLNLFCDASQDFPEASNLVRILAKREKLGLLPDIASSYQQRLFEHQKILEAKIVTASELNTTQKEQLTAALQKRYQQQIFPHYQIDNKLIGGMVVYINNQMIDGSIVGLLQRLKQNLIS